MKQTFLVLLAFLFTLSASSQIFKKDDAVEVDPAMSASLAGPWKQATVVDYDAAGNQYMVKLSDGNKISIPSNNPEKWIRPVVDKHALNKYGPGAGIKYERRTNAMKFWKCAGSENIVKKNVKSLMASFYKDYPFISVDITSFKGQNGYDDKKFPREQVYPYKIEMLVHLKRTLIMGGKEYTQYQTWEFDRVYEFATRPGKACEFYSTTSNDAKLISSGWY